MENNMTPKDKEKYEMFLKKLYDKRFDEYAEKRLHSGLPPEEMIDYLANRIDDLEKLVCFCILALAGEGWFTPELKETVHRLGLEDLFKREK